VRGHDRALESPRRPVAIAGRSCFCFLTGGSKGSRFAGAAEVATKPERERHALIQAALTYLRAGRQRARDPSHVSFWAVPVRRLVVSAKSDRRAAT
jgi:hypothetical protein